MLSILGAGYAYPATVIDNALLSELNPGIEAAPTGNSGISSRLSSLTPEYLRQTGNEDPRFAYENALESPTDLAVRACLMAFERSGVKAEEIGLVVADCSTPRHTIPAEAARIAKRLMIKRPVYDVVASSAAMAAHLEMLLKWREDRMPPYMLCVSTNTPTQHINYRAADADTRASFNLGDGAAAMVLSMQHAGRLRVRSAFFSSDVSGGSSLVLPSYGHIRWKADAAANLIGPRLAEMLGRALEESGSAPEAVKFIGSQNDAGLLESLCARFGIPAGNHWHNAGRCGDSLGSGPLAVLAEHWDSLKAGDLIISAMAGPGLGFGNVVLEAR